MERLEDLRAAEGHGHAGDIDNKSMMEAMTKRKGQAQVERKRKVNSRDESRCGGCTQSHDHTEELHGWNN